MSMAGRINHLAKSLEQKGFYVGDQKPGKFNNDLKLAVLRLRDSGETGKKISVPLNAFRTVSPIIFRGLERNCTRITPTVKEALNEWLNLHYPSSVISFSPEQERAGIAA